MSDLIDVQKFRGILLLNNLPALILSFVGASDYWYYRDNVFDVLGSFLIISWIQTALVLIQVVRLKVRAHKNAYFTVPVTDDFQIRYDDAVDEPSIDSLTLIAMTTFDVICGIAILVATIFAFVAGRRGQLQTVAALGGVVAATIHFFMLCSIVYYCVLGKYRLKVTLVRTQQEGRSIAIQRSKEQRPREHSSPRYVEEEEQGQISPRPYRGSPSTKPTPKSTLSSHGPIKLVDPVEGDALMADHD